MPTPDAPSPKQNLRKFANLQRSKLTEMELAYSFTSWEFVAMLQRSLHKTKAAKQKRSKRKNK